MIVVVGGGVSGLSAAWRLAQAGMPCTLLEAGPRLGGVIQTEHWEGCVLESGPDSFLAVKPEAEELARALGLGEELISSNDSRRATFIWSGGRLHPLPEGMMMMAPTQILPVLRCSLLSWRTKIRMALDYCRRPQGEKPERTVAELIEDHYGRQAVDYLAEPLLAGVYGGDARLLSASAVLGRFVEMESAYGSLTRGVMAMRRQSPPAGPLFRSLKQGMASLIERLLATMQGRVRIIHQRAEALELGDAWRIRAGGEWIEAKHLVLAVPAYAAAQLLAPLDAELARLLDTIDYSSSVTVSVVYRPGRVAGQLEGFGFLVPKAERRALLACTYVHNKFPCRAAPGYAVLRAFLGGAGNARVLESSDEAILAAVLEDLRQIAGVSAAPDYWRIARWPRSMAQYTLGHAYRVARIEQRRKRLPGLHLAGNAYSGIGVPDCIRSGKQAALEILQSAGA